MAERPDSIGRNVARWTQTNAEYTDGAALETWRKPEIAWGVLGVPEASLGVLGDVAGLDVVELGCGTAYFSAWLARRGARPVGVDPTPAQLETARRCQRELELSFPLVEAPGEDVPLPDASFDLALSEYGASIWAEPSRWLAEAARLLRPGGRLVFLRNSTLAVLCTPDEGEIGARLVRPQFGMYSFDWGDPSGGVEYQLAHGDWIRLLRLNGFEVEELHELQAPEDAKPHPYYGFRSPEWARSWPEEEIWVARRRS